MPRMSHVTALRCIGQDIERRGLKSFDIRLEGDEYVVSGGYQPPPSDLPVNIRYTIEDIEELDRIGAEQRGGATAPGEFLNAIQILRSIGGYLDKHKAKLVRLSNIEAPGSDPLYKVEYLNAQGDRVIDDRAGTAIYDMCVAMYKQRGKLTGTGGRRR